MRLLPCRDRRHGLPSARDVRRGRSRDAGQSQPKPASGSTRRRRAKSLARAAVPRGQSLELIRVRHEHLGRTPWYPRAPSTSVVRHGGPATFTEPPRLPAHAIFFASAVCSGASPAKRRLAWRASHRRARPRNMVAAPKLTVAVAGGADSPTRARSHQSFSCCARDRWMVMASLLSVSQAGC
jgi:hypothetical protein